MKKKNILVITLVLSILLVIVSLLIILGLNLNGETNQVNLKTHKNCISTLNNSNHSYYSKLPHFGDPLVELDLNEDNTFLLTLHDIFSENIELSGYYEVEATSIASDSFINLKIEQNSLNTFQERLGNGLNYPDLFNKIFNSITPKDSLKLEINSKNESFFDRRECNVDQLTVSLNDILIFSEKDRHVWQSYDDRLEDYYNFEIYNLFSLKSQCVDIFRSYLTEEKQFQTPFYGSSGYYLDFTFLGGRYTINPVYEVGEDDFIIEGDYEISIENDQVYLDFMSDEGSTLNQLKNSEHRDLRRLVKLIDADPLPIDLYLQSDPKIETKQFEECKFENAVFEVGRVEFTEKIPIEIPEYIEQ